MAGKGISDVLIKFKGDHKGLDSSINGSNSSLNKFGTSAKSVAGSLVKIGAVGAVALAGLTAVAWKVTEGFKNYGVELDKINKVTGVSVETTSQMAYAAEQEHASLEDLMTGWRRLAKSMSDADDGLAESKRTFEDLGIAIYDSSGQLKSVDSMTMEVADAFSKMTDDTKKAALAQDLFGRSGMNMVPFLELGSKGIHELMKESVTLGNVWTGDMAASAKLFDDKLTALGYSFKAMKWQIGNALMPEFEKISDWLLTNREWMVSSFKEIFDVEVGNLGADIVAGLDNIKSWVETNKDTLAGVFDGMKTAADMTLTSIKVMLASMMTLHATGQYLKSIGTESEGSKWAKLQGVSAGTAAMYQDIGQKDWAKDIVGGLSGPGQNGGGRKRSLLHPIPEIGGAERLAFREAKQQINIKLDGDAVVKFLSGMMLTTAGDITNAGT